MAPIGNLMVVTMLLQDRRFDCGRARRAPFFDVASWSFKRLRTYIVVVCEIREITANVLSNVWHLYTDSLNDRISGTFIQGIGV